MAANGNLIFQDTNKATFVGANSNVVIDTVHASFGVGVDVNGPTSNLHVVGNAYVTSNLEVGTANLFVDTVNSRVGVGTTSPDNALHIRNAIPAVLLDDSGDDTKVRITGGAGGDLYVDSNWGGSGNTGDIIFREASSEKMRIAGNGNVGIGTAIPSHALTVAAASGDAEVHIKAQGNDGGDAILYFNGSSTNQRKCAIISSNVAPNSWCKQDLHFCMETTSDSSDVDITDSKMVITNNGNVGIGEDNPPCKLTVGDDNVSVNSTGGVLGVRQKGNTSSDGITLTSSHANSTRMYKDANGHFHLLNTGGGTFTLENGTGNVGIGTTSPQDKLHTDIIRIGDWSGGGNGFKFSMDTNAYLRVQYMTGQTVYKDIMALRYDTGNVGIGVTSPACPFHVKFSTNAARSSGVRFEDANTTNYWENWINNGDLFYFAYNGSDKGYISRHVAGATQMNFTGQHRTFIKDVSFSQASDLEGLIVSSDQNKYIKMSGGIEAGSNAITTNESLPVVSLSTKVKDKKCFGVISASEDPETREEMHGNFGSIFEKEKGDTRVYINSVGEGAIWVTDINGSLESGDYITTSNVAGYGQKQDSDSLKNYTVAKITMDCDFDPVTQPVQIIRKELSNVNYWVKTTYENVTEEEYSNLIDENRQIIDGVYQKITKEESKTEQEGYELEVRQELVNILDEHGQIQWEDHPTETEKAYKIRYLDANGNITDETNAVHKAAFVGCTYHCG